MCLEALRASISRRASICLECSTAALSSFILITQPIFNYKATQRHISKLQKTVSTSSVIDIMTTELCAVRKYFGMGWLRAQLRVRSVCMEHCMYSELSFKLNQMSSTDIPSGSLNKNSEVKQLMSSYILIQEENVKMIMGRYYYHAINGW